MCHRPYGLLSTADMVQHEMARLCLDMGPPFSPDLFQKLFRQDLLVASLFRNFLLAERIMRSYSCTPVSSPRLPPTYMHAMW